MLKGGAATLEAAKGRGGGGGGGGGAGLPWLLSMGEDGAFPDAGINDLRISLFLACCFIAAVNDDDPFEDPITGGGGGGGGGVPVDMVPGETGGGGGGGGGAIALVAIEDTSVDATSIGSTDLC